MHKTLSCSQLSFSCLKFHWPCSDLYGFVPCTKCQFGFRTPKRKKNNKKRKNLHLPFLWPSSNLSSELNVNRKKLPTLSDSAQSHADSEQPWRGFCLIRGKILLSWSVLVVSFLNCIWSRACFALKRQKKTNDLLHIWHYLLSILKNDLTRSPSWDEHISFSRVPWPSSRHQVNTLFCSIQGQKWAFRGF